MDPVTSIVTAIIAGVAAGGTKAAEEAIKDGYQGLKNLIRAKLGGDSGVAKAIGGLEEDPKSAGYQTVLKEQVEREQLGSDADIRAAAEALLARIKQQPGGEQHVQQIANGIGIAQAAGGGTASVQGVTVNQPPKQA